MLNTRIKFKEKKSGFLKNSRGFTLVETLIAIVIITVGLLGAVTLIIYAISVASLVRGKLIASQLAQEGVEVVRNMRDNNWLEGKISDNNWHEDLSVGKCVPVLLDDDPNDDPNPAGNWGLSTPFSDSKSIVYFNEDSKFYGQSENGFTTGEGNWKAAPLGLKRWLDITYDDLNYRLKVVSHVEWSERGKTYNFEITDYLYNWQKGAGICPPGYTESKASISGISYYFGSGDNTCTGQEVILLREGTPYRPFSQDQSVCVSDTSFSQQEYCSSKSSAALCEKIIGCETAEVYFVVDPL